MRRTVVACFAAAVACSGTAWAQLDALTSREAAAGLKAALERASSAAVASLGRTDGFFANPRVRIPLPESMRRAERNMRRLGMGKHADELILSLNRAAEAAVPEAGELFVESVRRMSMQDAKGILQGGDSAGTEYVRRHTESELRTRFLPIVQRATGQVGLAQQYKRYAERGAALGLVRKEDAGLDAYVTARTLDGLFVMLAEEEKKIREDPLGAGSTIIRKVFGVLR